MDCSASLFCAELLDELVLRPFQRQNKKYYPMIITDMKLFSKALKARRA